MNTKQNLSEATGGGSELNDRLEPVTCSCMAWCRDFSETQGGKFPISDHAPGCENYKSEPFARAEHDGTACVMEQHEVAAMVDDSEEGYTVNTVMMTRDQFERIQEFEGF